ncbi:MAG TPA: hypothetical protein DHV36_21845 [Desulfobacteraceae bacterium]|nr:hypothetical protein [Desulfobacteraceae bacterium]
MGNKRKEKFFIMFKKRKRYEEIQDHFLLNSHVDLAINYERDNQSTSRVIIQKADYFKHLLMMYQPGDFKVRRGQVVNISTLHFREKRISLFGRVIQADSKYFIVQYKPEIVFINLRRGFRENPKIIFDIDGKIELLKRRRSISDKLILKDISITGIGFLLNGYKWRKDILNRQLNFEGRISLNFVNKKDQSIYVVDGDVNLVRVIQTANGFIEGYEFMGKKSDNLSKIIMDSQIAHRQGEIKYYG